MGEGSTPRSHRRWRGGAGVGSYFKVVTRTAGYSQLVTRAAPTLFKVATHTAEVS